MKTCKSCGHGFDDRYGFCPKCGQAFIAESDAEKPLVNPDTTEGIRIEKLFEKDRYAAYEVHLKRIMDLGGFAISINSPIGAVSQKYPPKPKGTCHKNVTYQPFIAKGSENTDSPRIQYVLFFYFVVDDWKDTLFNKASQREIEISEAYFDSYADRIYSSGGQPPDYDTVFASLFGDVPVSGGNCPDCNGTGYIEQVSKAFFGKVTTTSRQKCKRCGGTGKC